MLAIRSHLYPFCSALVLFLATLTLSLSSVAIAEIDPSSVVVLANAQSPASLEVARHYLSMRGLDENRLISIAVPIAETISRKEFDDLVIPTLRKQLIDRGLAENTRVLVTTFDMPLRVASPDSDSKFHTLQVDAIRRRDLARASLFNELQNLKKLAGEKPIPADGITSDTQLTAMIQESVRGLVKNPPTTMDPAQVTKFVSNAIQRIAGASGLASTLRANPGNEKAAAQLQRQRELVGQISQQLQSLEQLGASAYRDTVYNATAFLFGGVGVLSRATSESKQLQFEDADASFDSELSLLWWDTDMYPLSKRLPNPWFLLSKKRNIAMPIVMVSRLDGPTKDVVLKLINDTKEAEESGLHGKVFVDARGLKTPGDEYFVMDTFLRDFGWSVREDSDYSVYIDDHDELLTKAHDVALYVGWYSVGKFVGDFTFAKGAMGYHIASSEAISVRDPENTGWCKNLIDRGVVATLGPVDEPYLDSFPAPSSLFGLMMTGRYTLAEAYYLASKYISWRMVLFGDPLYNPWRKKPAMKLEDVKLPEGSLVPELGKYEFAESYNRRAKLVAQRESVAKALNEFLKSVMVSRSEENS